MTVVVGSTEWRSVQRDKQKLLNDTLIWLRDNEIQSPDSLKSVAENLITVYENKEFRHRYSDILEIIHDLEDDGALKGIDRVEIIKARGENLAAGIRELYVHIPAENCGTTCPICKLQRDPRLSKLYDHINLEARRASYEAQMASETLEAITAARTELASALQASGRAKKAADKASTKARQLQVETVSILGVFSAIILAFNASVTFTTSAIAAVDTQPPFNVAFIVSIVGLVLFNCLYGSFALIYRIIRPEKSPDRLLDMHRIAGIELLFLALCLALGTLSYTYGDGGQNAYAALAMSACCILAVFGTRYLLWSEA